MIAPGPNNRYFRVVRALVHGWILLLVLALYPYTEDPAAPIKHTLSAFALLGMSLVWATGVATGHAPYRRPHAPLWVLLAFLAIQMLAALFSTVPRLALAHLAPWITFAIIAFVVFQVCTEPRHLRALFRTIVLGITTASVYGLAQHIGLDLFPWADRAVEEYRGLPATYGNPNFAGHAIVVALVLCAALAFDAGTRAKRRREAWCYVLPAGILLTHLYLSGMRGGVLALGSALLFVTVYGVLARQHMGPPRSALIAGGATIVVLAVAGVLALMLAPRLDLDSATQLRLHGYAGAAAMFGDHWLIGVGPGHYARHSIAYWSDFEGLWYALEHKRNFHVHNEWLEVAVESGLPGLLLFLLLVLAAVVTPFANPAFATGRHRALLLATPATLVAMAIDACTGFNLHVPVTGGLFFVLVVAQPGPDNTTALRGPRRIIALLLIIPAVWCAGDAWNQFQASRLLQQAQAARDGAREGQDNRIVHDTLEAARKRTVWNSRIHVLRGDLALAEERYEDALTDYGIAAFLEPYLPGIDVQRARTFLRLAEIVPARERSSLLESARHHARVARNRCPALPEAWAMIGWTAYMSARDLPDNEAPIPLAEGLEAFHTARRLGLAGDANIDAALCQINLRLRDWPAAAEAAERSVMTAPANAGTWKTFARAAAEAGQGWPDRYRQALLYHLGAFAQDSASVDVGTASDLAGRLAALPVPEGGRDVIARTLVALLPAYPGALGLWGAWLSLIENESRPAALQAELIRIEQNAGTAAVPSELLALTAALESPDAMALGAASHALLQALSTVPGGGRRGPRAHVYRPFIELLDRAATRSGLAPALLGEILGNLGAACVEVDMPDRALLLLQEAARVLPPADAARVAYYQSRLLDSQGQHDAALALARKAVQVQAPPVEFQWQLAWCLANTGEAEAAAFLYESLLASLPPGHAYQRPLRIALEAARQPNGETTP